MLTLLISFKQDFFKDSVKLWDQFLWTLFLFVYCLLKDFFDVITFLKL